MASAVTYIYQLQWGIRADLVATLNDGEAWRELAGRRLGYGQLDIQRFSEARYKPGGSPADALLTHWGQRNGTAEELFKHLHALGLHQSMLVLKDSVPSSLHVFLHTSSSHLTKEASTALCGQGRNSTVKQPQPLQPPPAEFVYRDNFYKYVLLLLLVRRTLSFLKMLSYLGPVRRGLTTLGQCTWIEKELLVVAGEMRIGQLTPMYGVDGMRKLQ